MKKKLLIIPLITMLLASCNLFYSKTTSSQVSSITPISSAISSSSSEDVSSSSSLVEESSSVVESSSSASISSNVISSSDASSSSVVSSSEPDGELVVNLELFALNDFHGNVTDSDTGIGISKTSTLLKTYPNNIDNALYISSGDMWQGSAESNMTRGQLVNDWMNQLHFTSMTIGNHEFDWNSSFVRTNSQLSNFPYLGINIFDSTTNQRVDYAKPSTIIDKNGARIGIIGAIGDVYSSISASQVEDIYFKTGDELTALVKAEALRLRNEEYCDFIIYSIHEDDKNYDISLSSYVDLVLEGHTHQNYVRTDAKGIYHIQSGGYNKTINYINIDINVTFDTFKINKVKSLYTNDYKSLAKDAEAESLFVKYDDVIGHANDVIGYNASSRSSSFLCQKVADLYLEYGYQKWGSSYSNIFLGGGFIKARSPYTLAKGNVTYADLYALFPFDNDLVLCTTTGYYLNRQFVNTENTDYYINYTSYGSANKSKINNNSTYYLITDTYCLDYAPNHLTLVAKYSDDGFFARDMLSEYIKAGNLA